jgi:hypothetical protein
VIRRLAAATLLLSPGTAHACAVCGANGDQSAFLGPTIFLSLLPLGLVGSGLWWLRRRGGAWLRHELEERDPPPHPSADAVAPSAGPRTGPAKAASRR